MMFVSDLPITKILFTKIKTKTRLPCDNLARTCNIMTGNKPLNLRTLLSLPMMALFKYFKHSNPLPSPQGPLSMKVA